MRVDLLTKEYPPEIYGGAGVHVAELVKALRATLEVRVRCFGAPRDESDVWSYNPPQECRDLNSVLQTINVNTLMASDCDGAQLVHSHTWYANEAGRLAQQLFGIPHVITAHSLEPLRPWKKEQLGGGYAVSSSIEKSAYETADAVIAVSEGMRQDIYRAYPDLEKSRVHVIHNGIDISTWQPREDASVLSRFNINPDARSVVFVGRITRQKGLPYLLEAVSDLPDDVQIILCAGAADTPEILAEVTQKVEQLQADRSGVIWISEHLSPTDLSVILSHATTFVCPSIYEPLGIVNLEAMACGIPVVGTATGGIPEVIDDGVTGWLVPIEQHMDGTGIPLDPQKFVSDLSRALNVAVSDVSLAKQMGVAARSRAATHFNWDVIAEQTRGIYERVLSN